MKPFYYIATIYNPFYTFSQCLDHTAHVTKIKTFISRGPINSEGGLAGAHSQKKFQRKSKLIH